MSQKPLQIDVISLFPEFTASIAEQGVVGRAIQQGKASLNVINPRQFSTLNHQRVDDRPYGGGPGMVMKAEPLLASIEEVKAQAAAGTSCAAPAAGRLAPSPPWP